MKRSSKKKSMQILLVGIAAALSIYSCTGIEKKNNVSINPKQSYPPPVTVLLDTCPSPKKTELKNVPPPRVIAVPKTTGSNYKMLTEEGEEKVNLLPPAITEVPMPLAHFTNFNTEDGLALSSVLCGWADKKGRLWFGIGGGGLSCYDGTGFTNFNMGQGLAQSWVNCITEDKNGQLWFGTTTGGVSRYDGISFTNYTTRDGLADNTVFTVAKDKKGDLWFGTHTSGVSRYDGTKFATIDTSNGLPSNNVNEVAADSKGNIWFITWGGGICRYDGKDFTTFTTDDGLPTNYMVSICEDSKGNFWFGSFEKGVSRYDGVKFTTIATGNDPSGNTVKDITEDKDGNLWFTTYGAGVICYDGKRSIPFTTEQGLANNVVNSITKDQHGNLWFGTDGGLSRYNGKSLNSFTSKQGWPENVVYDIKEDQAGNIWLGTNGNGICRYDGNTLVSFTTEQGLANNFIYTIVEDQHGDLWFSTGGGGVSRFDGASFTTFTTKQGLGENHTLSMAEDKDGNLWIATVGGLSRYDGKTFTTFTTAQGLANNLVASITKDKSGNLWFGTAGGGVSRFDGKRFTTFTTEQGLASNTVMAIKEDKNGILWFGTQAGISRYDGSGFINFNTSHGLPDDNVVNIIEDEQGVIWLGTYNGFCSLKFKTPIHGNEPGEIKGAGLFKISNEQLKNYEPVLDIYNNKTGYPVKDIMVSIIKKHGFPAGNDKDVDVIWAPTGDPKVIRFDPKAVVHYTEPPAIFIRSIKIDEQAVNWYGLGKTKNDSVVIAQQEAMLFGSSLSLKVRDSLNRKFGDIQFDSITPFNQVPLNLVLPYIHNHVSFDFGAIETNRNFMVRYQYMLEGYDKEWSPITEKNSVSYGNISEGRYTFKLKARSPEGVWDEPIEYKFRVLPPWFRTWWAYLSYILLFSLLMYALFRWRTKALKQDKINLEEKVNQRTNQLERKSTELEKSLEDLKATQKQLIQSEKMASLGELTAGIAHEIQNPLNFVNNFSEVSTELVDEMNMEIDKGNTEDAKLIAQDLKQNLEKINHHGKRAGDIVKGMLQHSRSSSGVKEPTNINALADEYLRLAYHGLRAKDKSFNAAMKTDFDESIGNINIIPQDIGRVILNLITNAFYVVNEKSKQNIAGYEPTVTVATKRLSLPSGGPQGGLGGRSIEIKVSDNGGGIPQKILDKIFQPFFTTKPTGQGTGLGLSLSYDIIKAHGGEIKVTTKENEGTEFTIILTV